jgi:hypothetical protein
MGFPRIRCGCVRPTALVLFEGASHGDYSLPRSSAVDAHAGRLRQPPINERITQADPSTGYRPYLLLPKRVNNDPSTLFFLAFSGGGTRAAALSY